MNVEIQQRKKIQVQELYKETLAQQKRHKATKAIKSCLPASESCDDEAFSSNGSVKILFVSKTGELAEEKAIEAIESGIDARSAGLNPDSLVVLNNELIEWADKVEVLK